MSDISSRSDIFHHRLDALEKRSDKLESGISELCRSTSEISSTLRNYVDLEARVRRSEERCFELEKQLSNNKIVLNAIRWLAIAVGGSATTIIVASVLSPMVVN